MKEYFSHDYNASSDSKIMALIYDHGAVGYGIYWVIIEMLHIEKAHSLPLQEYLYKAIASRLNVSADIVGEIIDDSIHKYKDESGYGLFYMVGEKMFSSKRVNDNIKIRNKIIKNRSTAGKISQEIQKARKRVSQKDKIIEEISPSENSLNNVPEHVDNTNQTTGVEQTSTNKRKEKKKEKEILEIKGYEDVAQLCENMIPELQEAIKEHINNRNLKNRPFTVYAFNNFLKSLYALSSNNQHIAIEIINQSIINRWTDIYELKTNNYVTADSITRGAKKNGNGKTISPKFIEWNDRILTGEAN